MKNRILLINMPSSIAIYGKSKLKVAIGRRPFISLPILATSVIQAGGEAKILDLMISEDPEEELSNMIKNFGPKYVGLTFTTPLFHESKKVVKIIKETSPNTIVIVGGVHPTLMPEEVLRESDADIAVFGEGDKTLQEIIQNKSLDKIQGIAYKKAGKMIKNKPREVIDNLDSLPFPAWCLYDIKKYKNPRIIAKKNPVATIETSRGCVAGCTYCSKAVFGRRFRIKSARRVVEEFEYAYKCGFREVHIWDDMFSTNLKRAKDVCKLLIKRKCKMVWRMECGIRVDSVDQEFFELAKKAGCYGVSFGFESGNQEILDMIKKGIKLEQSKKAVDLAKKAGLEIVGFFMLGLPGETVKTMDETIDFAKSLNLDYAKFTIVVPLPGTELFFGWKKQGLIRTEDWSKYNYHTTSEVYDHPNLDWKTLEKYYHLAYKKFYFRPPYVLKRIVRSCSKGEIIFDIYYVLKTWLL